MKCMEELGLTYVVVFDILLAKLVLFSIWHFKALNLASSRASRLATLAEDGGDKTRPAQWEDIRLNNTARSRHGIRCDNNGLLCLPVSM